MKNNRNYILDNTKFILMFLVVFGHGIEIAIHRYPYMMDIYRWIYTFHMPAFIFVSGYFAKDTLTWRSIRSLIFKLLVPYAFFQVIYYVCFSYFLGQNIIISYTVPIWITWYLISLFSWSLLLPVFKKIPYGFFFSILLAMVVFFIKEIEFPFSLARTFGMFPFFYFGFLAKERDYVVKWKNMLSYGLPIGLIYFIALYIGIHFLPVTWEFFYYTYPYQHFQMTEGAAIFYRLLLYAISFLSIFMLFLCIPRYKEWWSYIGEHTMAIYLLHGILLRYLIFTKQFPFTFEKAIDVVLWGLLALLACFILGSRIVSTIFTPVLYPNTLFQKKK